MIEVGEPDRERHRAASVETVHETERMPNLVDCLLERASGYDCWFGGQAVELRPQSCDRHEGHSPAELGLTVDEAQDGHEEISFGDTEQFAVVLGQVMNEVSEDLR